MDLTQLANLGEFIGGVAVLVTLAYLAIQVRHGGLLLEANRRATEESNRLARAAATDRYSDAVSRWRGRIIESEQVATIFQKAIREQELDDVSELRLHNLLIDWHNTYRANYRRAKTVGDEGLVRQAVISVAVPLSQSAVMRTHWERGRRFNELGVPDFLEAVDEELAALAAASPATP